MARNIYEHMKNELVLYLDSLKDGFSNYFFEYEIMDGWNNESKTEYEIEVDGYYKSDIPYINQQEFVLLRFYINKIYKQVHISNILLPYCMQHNGIGKKLIHKIFLISEKYKYELYIVDMVDSFYDRMIARGALPCIDVFDAVKIVSSTNLNKKKE